MKRVSEAARPLTHKERPVVNINDLETHQSTQQPLAMGRQELINVDWGK